MATFAQVNERYIQAGIMGLTPALNIDQTAERSSVAGVISPVTPTASVNHVIYEVPSANTTPLPSSGSASTNITPTADVISVTMAEYGEGVRTVNAISTLSGSEYDSELAVAIEQVALEAGKTINALAGDKLINTIPASGSFTHGTMSFADVQASGLVYLGTDTAGSETARNLIGTSDTISAKWIDRAFINLTKRGVKPYAVIDGNPVYVAVVHPNVWYDIQQDSSNNSFINTQKYVESGVSNIIFNSVGIWKGFVWVLDNEMVYTGAGASGINVYPVAFYGKNYLIKDFGQASMLPVGSKNSEIINLMESAQIRLLPAYDSHDRHKKIAWYAYLGYNIFNPNAGFRLEVASSLG